MRRTKIIATLGPATWSSSALERLIGMGLNVFRFNMSHANHDKVREIAKDIRAISARLGKEVALLLDTQGPAIRTGDVAKPYDLQIGDWVSFTVKGQPGTVQITVDCNYPQLVDDIEVGRIVIVDNGNLRMRAIEKRGPNELVCEVLTAGPMGSRRHINLPGVKVNLPALTEKDYKDIELAFECGMDFIAMSFVREAADVLLLRSKIRERNSDIRIIAKIEDQLAVQNLEEIIAVADGIMVARGDLGIEVPYEELPIIQRRAVNLCLAAVKPVIVATHLLESMITNPSPTRAEITDIANAVFEHADAIMLSGETTTGKFPFECVEIMDRIASRIEQGKNGGRGTPTQSRSKARTSASTAPRSTSPTRARPRASASSPTRARRRATSRDFARRTRRSSPSRPAWTFAASFRSISAASRTSSTSVRTRTKSSPRCARAFWRTITSRRATRSSSSPISLSARKRFTPFTST